MRHTPCTVEAAGDCHSHAGLSRQLCFCAGEPELAVAIHCLQRPIVVYRQVRYSSPVTLSSKSQVANLHCQKYHVVIDVYAKFNWALGVQHGCCLQVRRTLLGEMTLEKVSVYGAEEYPGKTPVCVLFSGAHYDTLLQVPAAR